MPYMRGADEGDAVAARGADGGVVVAARGAGGTMVAGHVAEAGESDELDGRAAVGAGA